MTGTANSFITPVTAAIFGLGLNEGAYMAEIVRAGLQSVEEGQTEAAQSLGMTRPQARGLIATQASVLALTGLLFGVPIGLAVGRTTWRAVADYTPLQYVAPRAFWALVLIGPMALLLANLLAAWPGQQAARLRIGHVLRAE